MSEADPNSVIEVLNGFLDQLERGDLEGAMELIAERIHPACEFTSAIGTEVEGTTFVGLEEIEGWFASLVEAFELKYEDRRFRALDEGVILLLTTNRLRGRGSGAEVVREIGIVWELEGGLARKVVSYGSREEAIAAAEALTGSDVSA